MLGQCRRSSRSLLLPHRPILGDPSIYFRNGILRWEMFVPLNYFFIFYHLDIDYDTKCMINECSSLFIFFKHRAQYTGVNHSVVLPKLINITDFYGESGDHFSCKMWLSGHVLKYIFCKKHRKMRIIINRGSKN